jgi:hypothetical protein
MTTSLTTEVRLTARFKSLSSPVVRRTQHAPERQHSLVVWIALIGIFFPPVLIPLGGINLTPSRFVVMLLLVPALGILLKRGRNRDATDFFAVALATWMLLSSYLNGGFRPYVGAEALEFFGAYLVGRAFVFGPSNLRTFVKVLRQITVVVIALALLDVFSGRYVTMESFGIMSELNARSNYRMGLLRASSVFEGGELYGTFCVAAAAIFLYSERGIRRLFYVGLSFFGCALSLSSGPLMGLGIVTAVYSYDRITKQYPWRWKALTIAIVGFLLFVFLFFDHPLQWTIVHLTLDPQTGFFRLGSWEAALPLIDQSPIIGHGFSQFKGSGDMLVYLSSVDSVWLVDALRYGLPAAILLILIMFSPFLRRRRKSTFGSGMDNTPTGVSLAIVAMGLIGLTVHFWDAVWLFLNLCIGIRISVVEYERDSNHPSSARSTQRCTV